MISSSKLTSIIARRQLSSSKPLDYLKNKDLWKTTGFINGEFTSGSAKSGSTFSVTNPANGALLAELPRMTGKDVNDSAKIAFDAWQSWKETTGHERSKFLFRIAELMKLYRDDLAAIITLEAGKPLAEAKGEIAYATSFMDYYAEESKRIYGEIIPSPSKNKRLMTIKQPVGPVALITPWNFPSAMITRKLAPALAAGCTAVIKPANDTPLSALAMCQIVQEAGVPPGVVNCLTVGREEVVEVGTAMCHSTQFRKLSFTGSTAVGKWLMKESSYNVKKLSLELGGNAAFIVFADADLDVALQALMQSKFRNAGQACIASNRILVQDSIYDQFAEMVSQAAKKLTIGPGFELASSVGPLINATGLEKVHQQVLDATGKGAKILTGGKKHAVLNEQGGFFYEPTVLTGVTKEMLPYRQETFGPVVPLMKFSTVEEAISLANDTE